VIVPARNEAASIGATIASLGVQTGVDFTTFLVIVLANNCDDDTAAQVLRTGQLYPHLNLTVVEKDFLEHEANIGTVRRFLMDDAVNRLPTDGVIASTDGDTVVSADWLSSMFQAIDEGADLVGGRILARATPGDQALRRVYLADTTYRFLMSEVESLIDPTPDDPWPRHFQHFGASLAVTRAAYLRVGGLPRVPCLEDMALYDCLRCEDAVIRHSLAVNAITSTRMTGRVGIGLSTQLGEWRQQLNEGRPSMMESADFVIARARERRRLRERWTRERMMRFGEPFGCLYDRAIADFQPPVPYVEPLNEAVANFRARLVDLRRSGPAPLLSDPFEQVKSVRFFPTPVQTAERSA